MVGVIGRTDPGEWRIVDELYPSLRRFAAVVAPWDVEADDRLHDALVEVLRRRRLSDLDHPAAYLRKVMINLAAGHGRRRATWKRAMARLRSSGDHFCEPEYPSNMAELGCLPPRQRAMLYLAGVEGYHFDEIARLLGCSEAAARKGASRQAQLG